MLMLAIGIALLSAPTRDEGHLVIYPKIPGVSYEELRTRDDGTVIGALVPGGPDDPIDLDAAFSPFEGAPYVEVVDGVEWEIVSGEDIASINELGEITFNSFGRIRVRATFLGLESDTMPVTWAEFLHGREKIGPWDEEAPVGPLSPGPSNQEISAAVRNGVRALEQRYGHIFNPSFSGVAGSIRIQTNSGTPWTGPGSFLGSSGAAAAYTNGFRRAPGGRPYRSGPLMVVADTVASAVVAEGLTDASGHLTEHGQTIMHEMLHAILDELGIKMSEELEEALAHAFGELLANKLIDLSDRLERAARNGATQQDRTRIGALIQTILAELKRVRSKARGAKENEALDKALRHLNLDDSDGDGIPDMIEDMIDRHFPERPEWLEEILSRPVLEDAGDPSEVVPL